MIKLILRIWFFVGATVLLGLAGWIAIAYQADGEAKAALRSESGVSVSVSEEWLLFEPDNPVSDEEVALIFPGALVDPVAYAPLLVNWLLQASTRSSSKSRAERPLAARQARWSLRGRAAHCARLARVARRS